MRKKAVFDCYLSGTKWSIYTTKSEPILNEIDRRASHGTKPPLGRGGKERGSRGKEFPPRPRFRRRNFSPTSLARHYKKILKLPLLLFLIFVNSTRPIFYQRNHRKIYFYLQSPERILHRKLL